MRPTDLELRDLADVIEQHCHHWFYFTKPQHWKQEVLPLEYKKAYTLVRRMQTMSLKLADSLGEAMNARALQTNDETYLKSTVAYAKDKELKQWLREAADKETKKHQTTPLVT